MINEPIFKDYKEKQAYYRELNLNRGKVIHVSKIIGKDGKILQPGKEYHSEKGDIRRFKKQYAEEMKNK